MINRLLFFAVAMLVLVFGAAAALASSAAAADAPLQALLQPHDDCPPPCWLGIRVGITSRDEALAILTSHAWVGEIFTVADQISWRWSGAQPELFDPKRDGLIGVSGGVVRRIRLQTRVTLGEWWGMLGAPDDAMLVRPLSRVSAYQIATYHDSGWQVISSFGCPVQPLRFWSSTTTLGQGELWTTETLNGQPFPIYSRAGWWLRLRHCRRISGVF